MNTEANGNDLPKSTISELMAFVSKHITESTPLHMMIKGFQKGVETTLKLHGKKPTVHDPGNLACSEKDIMNIAKRIDMDGAYPPTHLIEGFLEGAKRTLAVLKGKPTGPYEKQRLSNELVCFEHAIGPMAAVLTEEGMERVSPRESAFLGVSVGLNYVRGSLMEGVMVRDHSMMVVLRTTAEAMDSLVTDGSQVWRANLEAYCKGVERALNLIDEIEDETCKKIQENNGSW